MIVVDASIAVKWLLVEADRDAALDFLEGHSDRLHAPELLTLEVSRALVTAANGERITRPQARALLDTWLENMGKGWLNLHPTYALLTRAAEIALDLRHPLPDCIYLAVAMDLDCPLATADRKFAARATSLYDRIELIGAA